MQIDDALVFDHQITAITGSLDHGFYFDLKTTLLSAYILF